MKSGILVPINDTVASLPHHILETNEAIVTNLLVSRPAALPIPLRKEDVQEAAKFVESLGSKACRKRQSVDITFCVVSRDRSRMTQEWLLWHLMLGAQRFIFFDDGSVQSLNYLKPFIEAGMLDLHFTTELDSVQTGAQMEVYLKCHEIAKNYKKRNGWVAVFDNDEFAVLPGFSCLQDAIASLPPNASALAFPWRFVGPPDEKSEVGYRRGTVTAGEMVWTEMQRTGFSIGACDNGHVKMVVRTEMMGPFKNPHYSDPPNGAAPMFAKGYALYTKPPSVPGVHTDVLLNRTYYQHLFLLHYHTRSLSDWITRALRGRADVKVGLEFSISDVVGHWVPMPTAEASVWLQDLLERGGASPYATGSGFPNATEVDRSPPVRWRGRWIRDREWFLRTLLCAASSRAAGICH